VVAAAGAEIAQQLTQAQAVQVAVVAVLQQALPTQAAAAVVALHLLAEAQAVPALSFFATPILMMT